MSSSRSYTEISLKVIERFYEAIDLLIINKKIRGKNTYCKLAGIDSRNFYNQKNDMQRGWFQISWIVPLVSDFGVSAEWLLTGNGEVFK